MPPMTNTTKNAITHSSGTRHTGRPPHSVAIQANTWMPLGMAMSRLPTAKKLMPRKVSPVANM